MKWHFKSVDLKNMFGQKRDLEENIVYPEDVNDDEQELFNEDCYDLIKNGLNAGHIDWKKVFSNYTVEEIANASSGDQEIIDALLGIDIKKDVRGQIRGKVSALNTYLFCMSIFNNDRYPAYKKFLSRNTNFFIDEALCLDDLYFIYKLNSCNKLCGRLGEIVERFGWRETIKAFPTLEDEVLSATLIELLNGNLNCTGSFNESATELIQYMADVEKYRGVYFSVLHENLEDIMEVVPIFELPEIIRILSDDLGINEVYMWREVINRIDLELDEICHENVAAELFLKWISMFEYGYDMILNKLRLLLGTGAVELRTLRYLGISDELVSECLRD